MTLHLPEAFLSDLNAVFYRQDYPFLCVEMTTQGMQGCHFPRSGEAHTPDDAILNRISRPAVSSVLKYPDRT